MEMPLIPSELAGRDGNIKQIKGENKEKEMRHPHPLVKLTSGMSRVTFNTHLFP